MGKIAATANFHDTTSSAQPHRKVVSPDGVRHLIRRPAGLLFNREGATVRPDGRDPRAVLSYRTLAAAR